MTDETDPEMPEPSNVEFPFAFDPRVRRFLALAGITPGRAHVTVTAERLLARFGPWSLNTRLDNVDAVCITRDYQWFKAIGCSGLLRRPRADIWDECSVIALRTWLEAATIEDSPLELAAHRGRVHFRLREYSSSPLPVRPRSSGDRAVVS